MTQHTASRIVTIALTVGAILATTGIASARPGAAKYKAKRASQPAPVTTPYTTVYTTRAYHRPSLRQVPTTRVVVVAPRPVARPVTAEQAMATWQTRALRRITRGVKSGRLSRSQARVLRSRVAHVDAMTEWFAGDDGRLDRSEQRTLATWSDKVDAAIERALRTRGAHA